MAIHTFVEFDMPEAEILADLTGIRYDLESARSLAKRLQAMMEKEELNFDLVDALTVAILVRYIRPFCSGVRKRRLGENALRVLSEDQRHRHDRLRAFRDKHIAHSVNALEENQPIARYVEGREDSEGVYAVECHHDRVVGLNSGEVENVIELTTTMIKYVDSLLDKEKKNLLAVVRAVPIGELLSQRKCRDFSKRFADLKRSRKR